MAKANSNKRQKPYSPPVQGDAGPMTEAQLAGAVILTIKEDNGIEFRRKRRDHALEIMQKSGKINSRQCVAGLKLHELYCITEMGPDAAFTRVYVDTSSNPSAIALAQSERLTAFVSVAKQIPKALKGPVWHVAIRGRQLRAGYSRNGNDAESHCAQLQLALDIVANHLGL